MIILAHLHIAGYIVYHLIKYIMDEKIIKALDMLLLMLAYIEIANAIV